MARPFAKPGASMPAPPARPRILKTLADFGPLVVFFVTYKLAGLMPATLVLMATTGLAFLLLYRLERRLPVVPLFTLVIVAVFGGLSLWLKDATFIKMKPTIIQALFALILVIGDLVGKAPLKGLLGEAFALDAAGWRKLGRRYAAFFALLAIANEIVWRWGSEALWVDFKVFGLTGAMLIFSLAQIPLIRRHQIPAAD